MLFILHPIWAQEPLLRHYTAKDGLTSNTVYSVFEDSRGFLWFCTNQGVCQFDGHQFKAYTTRDGLSDNEVFAIREDNRQRLWFSGYNARPFYIFNGKVFNASNDPFCSSMEKDAILDRIKRDAGSTNPSVLMKNVHRPDLVLYAYSNFGVIESQYLCRIYERSYFMVHGYIVAADNDKIYKLDTQKHSTCFYHAGSLYVTDINSSGKLCLNKLAISRSGNYRIENTTPLPCRIYGCAVLDDTTLLFASDNGVLFFSDTYNCIDTSRTLLKNIPVSTIHKDMRGNFWFATLNNGVYMLPETHPCIFKEGLNLPEAGICAICVTANGCIVTGYANGVVRIINKTGIITRVLPGFTRRDRVLKMVQADNGKILVGTDRGLFICDTLSWRMKATAFDPMNISAIKEVVAIPGGILVACVHGAGKLDANGLLINNAWNGRATAVAQDSTTYWLGTLEGVYTNVNGRISKFSRDTLLSQSRITAIHKTCNGDILFCTHQNGVFIWNRKTIQHITEREGLSSNICKKMLVDRCCNAWIATNNGLDMVVKNNDSKTYSVRHIPLPDGIPANEIQDFDIQSDKLYIACTEGIITLDIEKQVRSWPIKPLITSVISRDTNFTGMDQLDLEYYQNDLTINFTGIALGDGGGLLYKYVLEGKRTDTVVTKLGSVNLDAIGNGKYRFLVWAKSSNSDWSTSPAVLSFTINPPFWQTYWFITLASLCMAGGIYMLVRMRIARIKKIERNKTALNKRMVELEMQALRAQINPHFIFNALNSIQNYYNQHDERSANRYMTTFAKLIRQTLTHSRQNWLSLTEECNMIRDYIDLEQMRFKNTFQYDIKIAGSMYTGNIKIPAMIIQPFVENAINHGLRHLENKEGYLLISFSFSGDQLLCYIEDNGVGFEQAAMIERQGKQHTSLGMEITKSRIETINQLYNTKISVDIIDRSTAEPGQSGTIIEIHIPLTYQTHYHEKEHADHFNS